jgi:CBS domain-containing protein
MVSALSPMRAGDLPWRQQEAHMKVEKVMSRDVATCSVDDTLSTPAQQMWDRTVGSVVVLSGEQLAGIITDRDIAMSAQTQGRPLAEIPVRTAMASDVVTCGPDDRLGEVVKRMVQRRVRRCPVVNGDGNLLGLLSLDDLAEVAAHRHFPGVGVGISPQDLLGVYAATAVGSRSDEAQRSADARAAAAALAGQVEARARRAWSQVRRTWSELEQDVPGRNRAARIGSQLVRALSTPRTIRRQKREAQASTNGQEVPKTQS